MHTHIVFLGLSSKETLGLVLARTTSPACAIREPMRYHVLRNVLVRDASIVLFTESEPVTALSAYACFRLRAAAMETCRLPTSTCSTRRYRPTEPSHLQRAPFPPARCSVTAMPCSACVPQSFETRCQMSTAALSEASGRGVAALAQAGRVSIKRCPDEHHDPQVLSLDRGARDAGIPPVESVRSILHHFNLDAHST